MTRIRADLLLLACAAIWGFAFLFQKSAMDHIGPFTFVGSRALLAALVLAPLAYVEHRRSTIPIAGNYLRTGIFAGLAFVTAAVLQQAGLITASVTNTAFLTALYVVITPFISFALMRDPIAAPIWLAVALSFVGTWLLGGGGTLTGFGIGDGLVALSAAFWALHMVIVGIAAPMGRSILFSVIQFAVVGVTALAGALLFETVTFDGLRAAVPNILYVGLLSTAISFTILTFALRATSPSEAAIIIMTETLFAAFGAWLVFNEGLTYLGALGAAAILSAAILVQLQQVRNADLK
ncbi:MAG: DMT family transporter [Rhizobiales bacterium]|nr:DMT family transporter [Hyphomicrobiales bacterium]